MTQYYPRLIAAISFFIGLVGMGVSLPLLTSLKTSLFFFLGASAWGFMLWRALSTKFREAFLSGWIWSSILHLGLLPMSLFINLVTGTKLPLFWLIFSMFILSVTGFFFELCLGSKK